MESQVYADNFARLAHFNENYINIRFCIFSETVQYKTW